jgi:hypothetical protein
VSLTVGVARVLDLTDARRQEHFGITLETLTGDAEDDLESCRIVADIARLEGYDAIRSPSAALDVGRISICTSMAERIICDSSTGRIESR